MKKKERKFPETFEYYQKKFGCLGGACRVCLEKHDELHLLYRNECLYCERRRNPEEGDGSSSSPEGIFNVFVGILEVLAS